MMGLLRRFTFVRVFLSFPFLLLLSFGVLAWERVGVQFGKAPDGRLNLLAEEEGITYRFAPLLASALEVQDRPVWVNLNPLEGEDQLLPVYLRKGPLGEALISADLGIKKSTQQILDEIAGEYLPEGGMFRVWIRPSRVRIARRDDALWVDSVDLDVEVEGRTALGEEVIRRLRADLKDLIATSPRYRDLRLAVSSVVLARYLLAHGKQEVLFPLIRLPFEFREVTRAYVDAFLDDSLIGGGIEIDQYELQEGVGGDPPEVITKLEPLPEWSQTLLRVFKHGRSTIVSDMDYTLLANAPLPEDVGLAILEFLESGGRFFVLTGSGREKIEKLFFRPILNLAREKGKEHLLKDLVIIGESGAVAWRVEAGEMRQVYCTSLVDVLGQERLEAVIRALREIADRHNLRPVRGDVLLVRESSIVFCPWGYGFTLEERERLKREVGPERSREVREALAEEIISVLGDLGVDLEVALAGSFSIDITLPGGKGIGMDRLEDVFGVDLRRVIYLGDGFGPGGNDEVAIGRVGQVVNVGNKPREGTVWVRGEMEASRDVLRVLAYANRRYNQWMEFEASVLQERLEEGDLAGVVNALTAWPEGDVEELISRLLPALEGFLEGRTRDVMGFLAWSRETGFVLQPFDVVFLGGGTSVRYLWRDVMDAFGDPSGIYLVHNLDDGGSSLRFMLAMEAEGRRNPVPLGDSANALTGFLKGWRYYLFTDDKRTRKGDLLLKALSSLVSYLRQKGEAFPEEEADDLTRLLYLMREIHRSPLPKVLEEDRMSLRNALLYSIMRLQFGVARSDVQEVLDSSVMLLGLDDKRIGFSEERPYTLFARRRGWTVRLESPQGTVYAGLYRDGEGWKVRVVKGATEEVYSLSKEGVVRLAGGVVVSLEDGVPVVGNVRLMQGAGFDPFVEVDGERVSLARDGSGRRRGAEATEEDKPVAVLGPWKVYISGEVVITQTGITEWFSPLPIVDLGLLEVETKDPKKVFSLASEERVRDLIAGKDVDLLAGEGRGPIVIGPGSFFTSILPFFKMRSVLEFLKRAKAEGRDVILVLPAGQDNETYSWDVDGLLGLLAEGLPEDYELTDLISTIVVPDENTYIPKGTSPRAKLSWGQTGVSVSGKAVYGLMRFSSPSARRFWEERLDVRRVPVRWIETEARVPRQRQWRLVYDPQAVAEKLRDLFGVERILPVGKRIVALQRQASDLYQQFRDRASAGLYEIKTLLDDLVEGRDSLKRWLKMEFPWKDLLERNEWEEVREELLDLYPEEMGDAVDKAIGEMKEVSRMGEEKGWSLGQYLVALGVVLERHNLLQEGDQFLRFGLGQMIMEGESLEFLDSLLPPDKGPQNEPPRRAGGILLF